MWVDLAVVIVITAGFAALLAGAQAIADRLPFAWPGEPHTSPEHLEEIA